MQRLHPKQRHGETQNAIAIAISLRHPPAVRRISRDQQADTSKIEAQMEGKEDKVEMWEIDRVPAHAGKAEAKYR